MPLEQIANIAEIFGMIVVAITLVFLTMQMRQNTRAIRSSAAQNVNEMAVAIYASIVADAEVADLLVRGLRDPDTLTDVETARFIAHWQSSFFTWQNWFHQWREDALDDGTWEGFSRLLNDIYQTPGIRYFWQQRRQYFSGEFREHLETNVFTQEATPG